MKNFYTQIKKTINQTTKNIQYLKKKSDASMLTKNDLSTQNKIIQIIQNNFPDVKQFICEENFKLKEFNKFDFKKPFAVIDPIDGTENFYNENGMFGTLISINSNLSGKIDLLYIPKKKILINRDNIFNYSKKPKKENNINLLSTKCLNKKISGSNHRMYGSSAFSFYELILGKANKFTYCDGAKIWDYYTGLRLLSLIGCNITKTKKNWKTKPNYKMNFIAQWK